jgi:hypothetical protein
MVPGLIINAQEGDTSAMILHNEAGGDKYTTKILKAHINASLEMQDAQLNNLDKIDNLIKKSELGMHKYSQIANYMSKVKKEGRGGFSEQEIEKYKEINKKTIELQQQLQEKNIQIARSYGLTLEKILQITYDLQNDYVLFQQYQELKESIIHNKNK